MVPTDSALLYVLAATLALSGCAPFSRDLQKPQTRETATCTFWRPVYGDFFPTSDSSFCKCIAGHLAAGYQLVGEPKYTECGFAPHA